MIQPGIAGVQWAQYSQADCLEHSKGERKLRVNLVSLFRDKLENLAQTKAKNQTLDRTYHLSIALEDNVIHEHVEQAGDKPFKAGWRKERLR